MVLPVPCEPVKIEKKGKGLPDVIIVTAILCKAGQRGDTQISVCSGRKEEHSYSRGCWPGYLQSLAASIMLAVVWCGEADPGMVVVGGLGECGSLHPWENRLGSTTNRTACSLFQKSVAFSSPNKKKETELICPCRSCFPRFCNFVRQALLSCRPPVPPSTGLSGLPADFLTH